MKKHYNSYFDETYYTETISNGLKVIIFHKPEFNTTTCAFGTPYGAFDIKQKLNNKTYSFNPGIAHFLEHKLFESKGDDITAKFSSYGASVNAFTSYRETVYFFTKSGNDIDECLNLLLDFVQSLEINEESVEKEKGIIIQEVSTVEQNPDQKLLHETYRCLYKEFPIKHDIGGDKETINAITKKELETCYRLNYHPNNMLLVVTSPVDPKKIIKLIKDNQKNKKFELKDKVSTIYKKESKDVICSRHTFKMPINTDKHLLAIKINPNFKDNNDAFKKEWCLRILLEAHFSYINPDYQKWLDKNIINDYFGYEIDYDVDCAYILFYIENNSENVLKDIIFNSLNKKILTEDILKQIKRRFIGEMFEIFNDIESFTIDFIRDTLNGLDFFKALDDLRNITLNDVENYYKTIDFTHQTYISMRKK